MQIKVDYDRCSGHGLCVIAGPDVYTLGIDGYNNTEPGQVLDELREQAARGAEACPERAIHLTS